MMQGDDIRNHRMQAEGELTQSNGIERHKILALWVIAEQLFELRSLVSISLERNNHAS